MIHIKHLDLRVLSGTRKVEGVKSDTTDVWKVNHECHSRVCSFYLGLSNKVLYNLIQRCGWTADVPDALYSKNKFCLLYCKGSMWEKYMSAGTDTVNAQKQT